MKIQDKIMTRFRVIITSRDEDLTMVENPFPGTSQGEFYAQWKDSFENVVTVKYFLFEETCTFRFVDEIGSVIAEYKNTPYRSGGDLEGIFRLFSALLDELLAPQHFAPSEPFIPLTERVEARLESQLHR